MEKINGYFQAKEVVVRESVRVIRRDPEKYGKMVLGLWLMPFIIRGTGVVKDAYFFMRHIDDVLDGDLILGTDSLKYIEDIKTTVASGEKSNNSICVLAKRCINILDKRKKKEDNPRHDFLDGIDGMVRDYKRMETKEILNENNLQRNYIDSFGPHHNIALIGVGSDLRSKEIEVFSYCQGLAYGLRDFDTDWQRGLINIPSEILKLSGLTINNSSYDVRKNMIIKDWVVFESNKSRCNLVFF